MRATYARELPDNGPCILGGFRYTYPDRSGALGGLGRTIKEEVGVVGQSTAVTQVLTEYGPCACSPIGKVKRVSNPHAPTLPYANVLWTEFECDVLGRTTKVKHPGNTGISQTVYSGKSTRVIDPAGKWKEYENNAFGQLVKVTEPDPADASGSHITNYAYNVLGNLTTVTMPRSTGTQTRTFQYYAGDHATSPWRLWKETHPEKGVTEYTYNEDGTLATKKDAKNQVTTYSYDDLKRVTAISGMGTFQYGVHTDGQLTNSLGRLAVRCFPTGCQSITRIPLAVCCKTKP
jgi:YD repeat-containing protein